MRFVFCERVSDDHKQGSASMHNVRTYSGEIHHNEVRSELFNFLGSHFTAEIFAWTSPFGPENLDQAFAKVLPVIGAGLATILVLSHVFVHAAHSIHRSEGCVSNKATNTELTICHRVWTKVISIHPRLTYGKSVCLPQRWQVLL